MASDLIMEILVYFYIFLEQYIFAYTQELKIRHHNQYFDRMVEMYCIEEEGHSSINPSNNTVSILNREDGLAQVTISELDEAAEDFFMELQDELNIQSPFVDLIQHDESSEYEVVYEQDYDLIDPSTNKEVVNEDYIQLTDLKESAELSSTGYESFASAKITDGVEGPQQWVVSIVGMEESYIHISDGKRLWVNVGEKVAKLKNGDVLILDVIRNGKEILVENLFRLETNVSDEYGILDEENFFGNDRIAI